MKLKYTTWLALAAAPLLYWISELSHWALPMHPSRLNEYGDPDCLRRVGVSGYSECVDLLLYDSLGYLFAAFLAVGWLTTIPKTGKFKPWARRALRATAVSLVIQAGQVWLGIGFRGWWDVVFITGIWLVGGCAALAYDALQMYRQRNRKPIGF